MPNDVTDNGGPSGAGNCMTLLQKYNLINQIGMATGGHPDGIQLNGGNFCNGQFSHNTYIESGQASSGGAQPAQIDAQLDERGLQLRDRVQHDRYAWNRRRATANYDIQCGDAGTGNSNVGYTAYGNYVDASGAYGMIVNGCTKSGD